ncbi:phage tail tip lysozyme [Weissella confusa]|uniref:phage tail tip lysozyme n=1 Tax=Weissella confusa TaxID=1583 RepID=UPI001781EA2C|nr:phage tail tip lysozyme [Weissella confusa]MBD5833926.1 peptidase [Weissella confusa]
MDTDQTIDDTLQSAKRGYQTINKLKRLKKYAGWVSAIVGPILVALLGFFLFMAIIASLQQQSCFTSNAPSTENAIGGDWKDADSATHKAMAYTVDQFKNLGMSGNNISAALAIGLRESNFNPAAVNPSGAVKGIYQWGTGGINGNRYGNTEDTVQGQIGLAVKELQTSHIATLNAMKDADLDGSLEAWDVYFEGVGKNDPQRKVAQTKATALEIQKVFNLNFDGHIDLGSSNALTAAGNDSANGGANSDSSMCSSSVSGATSGLPVTGEYRITGGYPDYDGQTGAEHYGVDFQTVTHTMDGPESYVYSVSDGVVVQKASSVVGGNYVIIKNLDGSYAYYGHAPTLDAIVVNVGDQVKKGQHISHEGQTGEATGIHVHFGLNTKTTSFGPHADGIVSPGTYLKDLPKELMVPDSNTVVSSDKIFKTSSDKGDNPLIGPTQN